MVAIIDIAHSHVNHELLIRNLALQLIHDFMIKHSR